MSLFIFLIIPPDDGPYDIVDAEYVAKHTGLSKRTILAGKGGIREIPRARRKPAGWFRADVEAWLKRQYEAAHAKLKSPRLIRRKPRAK